MDVYERLGVKKIINARSYSTRVSGPRLAPEVVAAMAEAAGACVRVEDLQEAAGRVIAEVTGAEAGYVASGAAAGLTLGAAACIAGLDPEKMNRLPDTEGMKNEVIVQRVHRNDYDHAVRAAGARFVEIGFAHGTYPYEMEAAFTERTAAVFVLAAALPHGLPLETIVEIAHRHEVPVLVDAAAELPPPENLRRFIAAGADLVAFSGGKAIGGPQATGVLCGRADLIRSVALQHQDMDVLPETWTWRHTIEQGLMAGPPYHGVGRGFKVGKEGIVGLVTALQLYVQRDHAAELARWERDVEELVAGLQGIPGVSAARIAPLPERPIPMARLQMEGEDAGPRAVALINALADGDPPIIVLELRARQGTLVFRPEAFAEGDAGRIVARVRELLGSSC